jgi:tRNA uridine 5-carbamoylmethylation protein Kti12
MTENKLAIILRGLPGSGKSYWAEQYMASQGLAVAVRVKQYGYFSTDSFFICDGKYRFEPQKLSQYHQLNLAGFIQALAHSEPLVICDNTNIARWEYCAYQVAAKALGYQVRVVTVGDPLSEQHQALCAKRNSHKVPLAHIKKMAQLFEVG